MLEVKSLQGTKVYRGPLSWMSDQLPEVSRVGTNIHGLLWAGNCFAFSEAKPAEYWEGLQEVLQAIVSGDTDSRWYARV